MINKAWAQRLDRLSPGEVNAVLALANAASDTDGAFPLSEHVVLHLRHGGDVPSVHLVVREGGQLLGYAHVDVTDQVEGPSAELVVHPMSRRRGLGRALVTAAVAAAEQADPAGRLRLWAHGDHPSASALALSLGFQRARVLWQMRRSLFAELPDLVVPEGVKLRPFRPGADEQAWVKLNREAFADHPEQGKWQLRDLHLRMKEPWFDPSGFLLAEGAGGADGAGRAAGGAESETGSAGKAAGGAQSETKGEAGGKGGLLGFHWTKVHGDQPVHDHDPIGEVYVLGVHPKAHRLGLGRVLTIAGLRHLRSKGLDQVMLYVDESNAGASALYTRLGFALWSTDVLFRRTSTSA